MIRKQREGVSDGLSLPCSVCDHHTQIDYHATDESWESITSNHGNRLGVICLECFIDLLLQHGMEPAECIERVDVIGKAATRVFRPAEQQEVADLRREVREESAARELAENEVADLRRKLEECAKVSHAHADDCESLREELEDCRRKLEAYTRELEGLTPGGSEFVGDPKRCADVVRVLRAGEHRALVSAKRQLAASSIANAALREAAQVMLDEFNVYDAPLEHERDDGAKARNKAVKAWRGLRVALALPADSLAQEVVWLLTHDTFESVAEEAKWDERCAVVVARLGGPK